MRIVVVGGGRVGTYLARELVRDGHTVAIIEANPEQARAAVEDTRVLVFEGDGTDLELLRAADAHRADWVLAVTGRDEENLVAAQLSKTLGARRVLARMNDPMNRATFEALGIEVIAVTDLMVQVISREVSIPELASHELFAKGRVQVVEFEVPETFTPRRVADLELPGDSVVVIVSTGERVRFARGDTVIGPGDAVVAAVAIERVPELRAVFEFEANGT
ncbi:MAG TPA: hypothetical protein ENK55_10425 [Actinobacteria bacterium]|nr:hypothetical protein [Actinomycetota bacterium]